MGFKEWIIPQQKHFFDLLEKQADTVLEGATALVDLAKNFENVAAKRDKIKEIESRGDSIVHTIAEELNKTFVTPFDHDDLSELTSRLDDILDFIEAASHRMWAYDVKAVPPDMVRLAEVIHTSASEVACAVKDLRNMNGRNEILKHCIEINRLENVGDDIQHTAVSALFRTKDAIEIMKLKEIYEHLEEATDKCEDVADVLKDCPDEELLGAFHGDLGNIGSGCGHDIAGPRVRVRERFPRLRELHRDHSRDACPPSGGRRRHGRGVQLRRGHDRDQHRGDHREGYNRA